MRVYSCPHCALSVSALAGSTVSHVCPKNRNRETYFNAQVPDNDNQKER